MNHLSQVIRIIKFIYDTFIIYLKKMGVTAYLKEMMNFLAVIDVYLQLMSFKHIK